MPSIYSAIGTTKMVQETPLPNCVMKIYVGRPDEHILAEHVKIGDYLTLVINIDHQGNFRHISSLDLKKSSLGNAQSFSFLMCECAEN